MCNAPKVAEIAPRTGYGGGFMDRETVEYKDRKEDDDYDEYGRRKKKRRVAQVHCYHNTFVDFCRMVPHQMI